MKVDELPLDKRFSRRLISPDTWLIDCYSDEGGIANPHLLIGEKAALIIDTADAKQPLREYIETYITGNLPLMVASTHSHFDHTGNNGQFNDCPIYMSGIAWEEIQVQRASGFFHRVKQDQYIEGDYVPHIVQEGDVIDLGNRQVEVIQFGGCHSSGSIGYLDRKYGIFFAGDEMESGQVLMQGDDRGGQNCVERMRDNLLHLRKWKDQIRMICCPHNGSPMHPLIADYFLENCQRIMSGVEGKKEIGSFTYLLAPNETRPPEKVNRLLNDPYVRRSEWKGTSIVYSTNRIFHSQITPAEK